MVHTLGLYNYTKHCQLRVFPVDVLTTIVTKSFVQEFGQNLDIKQCLYNALPFVSVAFLKCLKESFQLQARGVISIPGVVLVVLKELKI